MTSAEQGGESLGHRLQTLVAQEVELLVRHLRQGLGDGLVGDLDDGDGAVLPFEANARSTIRTVPSRWSSRSAGTISPLPVRLTGLVVQHHQRNVDGHPARLRG
ncbi:hypothetical protein ACFWXA_29525 [Streptomyces atroolivaceus]|uniref:hypothetical protein n=1 Tax=Streptomyces atroolivaceus TaxID=66869 RepID=UPI00366A19EF